MPNSFILDEYLVKLGFTTDTVGYARFANALRDASSLVENQTFGMAKKILEAQTAATGLFAAIGAGALGMADKVAMADQDYRLLALHMYTSLPVARELKVALDALGQPLENVMWDPELAARFHQLVDDQRTLTEELGPGFESQMVKIRDVRFEVTRFGVELQYLSMFLVDDLAKAFGTTTDGLLEKMRGFNDWFITHMPEIADWIANKLKPVLIDVEDVASETWVMVKALAAAFTNLVGALSGDTSLEGTTTNFEKFSTAIQKALGWLTSFVVSVDKAVEIMAHLVSAAADLNSMNLTGAETEMVLARKLITPGSSAVIGTVVGGGLGTLFGMPAVGAAVGGGIAYELGGYTTSQPNKTADTIRSIAGVMGVPPELALAVAQVESGMRQFDQSGNLIRSNTPGSHAMGMFQLQPGTASDMGVDPTQEMGNMIGGVKYLAQLLKKYQGNQRLALQAYAGGTPGYAEKVMAAEGGDFNGDINIAVHPPQGASAKEIAQETWKIAEQAMKQKVQRNLAEQLTPGSSY